MLDVRGGGKRLRAMVIGPGPKLAPTLVFLHEGLGCIALWREFPATIVKATGCNALIFERQGHGSSDPLDGPRGADYLDHEAGAVLPEVLDYFGIEKTTLIGHSDGGTIALLFAAMFPERTEGVVAIAAHAYVEEAALVGIRKTLAAFESDRGFRERLERYHGGNTAPLMHAWADTWLSEAFRRWNIETRLAAVHAPALIIQGTADEYATSEHVERIAKALGGPVETLLIEGAGHTPQRDAQDQIVEAIQRFVKVLYAN
jgi:pimeloyl-ACP methyl ester carboxylesterase